MTEEMGEMKEVVSRLLERVDKLERQVEQLFNRQAGATKAFKDELHTLWEALRQIRALIRKPERENGKVED